MKQTKSIGTVTVTKITFITKKKNLVVAGVTPATIIDPIQDKMRLTSCWRSTIVRPEIKTLETN